MLSVVVDNRENPSRTKMRIEIIEKRGTTRRRERRGRLCMVHHTDVVRDVEIDSHSVRTRYLSICWAFFFSGSAPIIGHRGYEP